MTLLRMTPRLFMQGVLTERCPITQRRLSKLCWNQLHGDCSTIACTCLCHEANPVKKEGEDD